MYFSTASRLPLPSCSKTQRNKLSTGTWLCCWWHAAWHRGWTTLWKHNSHMGYLISSPSIRLHKDSCYLRGCGSMCLAERDAIPDHLNSCLSHPWNNNSRGSGAAPNWKEVSELTGEEFLEFSFTELVSVSFFARVVMENPDQGVHRLLQWCGHSSEWENCRAKIQSHRDCTDAKQKAVLG